MTHVQKNIEDMALEEYLDKHPNMLEQYVNELHYQKRLIFFWTIATFSVLLVVGAFIILLLSLFGETKQSDYGMVSGIVCTATMFTLVTSYTEYRRCKNIIDRVTEGICNTSTN